METIKVQSASGREQITENELFVLSHEIEKNPESQGLMQIIASNHSLVPGLFSVRLFWDTDNPQPRGSLLGMNLSQNLKTYGIVDHSIWVETNQEREG
jgi:hypothetical protein